jgi:arylsulfatase A-like enzyme
MKPWIHFIDNTLIVFLSDNGACAEWDPLGFDNNPYPKNRLYRGSSLEQMGGPGTFHSYGTGWANVSNTPFRLYKHYNHEGGISAPLIMHWPSGLKRAGRIERSPAHVIDLATPQFHRSRS